MPGPPFPACKPETIPETTVNTNGNDDASRSRTRILLWVMTVSVLALVVIYWPGCRQYPPATSCESYTLMEALYTACNTKNADSINKIEQWVNRAAGEGKLGQAEQDAFTRII